MSNQTTAVRENELEDLSSPVAQEGPDEALALVRNKRIQFSEITVIIPTLNEERTIQPLLSQLCEQYTGIHVIVVDDESSDATARIVQEFAARSAQTSVRLLERRQSSVRGITVSVLDALEQVSTDYFIVMDGDLQHPATVVGSIVDEFSKGIDLVSASRLPYVEQQPFHRVLVTRIATAAAKYVLRRRGLGVSDPMSGLFGARTELVRALVAAERERFELAGYKILFDILRCLKPESYQRGEVFYEFGVRSGGSSKLRPIHAWYFLRSVFR